MPFRKGQGGRTKGSKNKRPAALLKEIQESGITPLQYMIAVMRDPKADTDRRDEMAKAAAPFVHSRLQVTKIQGDPNAPLFDLSGLSDSELAFLRRTILKAQLIDEA